MTQSPPPPYPSNIRLLKGALISVDSTQPARTVPFQYNPASVKRHLRPNQAGATDRDRSSAMRFTGAAVETVSLEARVESVGEGQAGADGVLPLLAALELFAYPSTLQVSRYQSVLASGSVDVVPPLAPRLIFVWGPHRVLPVRLSELEITEELFDAELNPTLATVMLSLRVLTYSDVTPSNGDYGLFVAYQSQMEHLAIQVPPSQASRMIGVQVAGLGGSS